jgi:FkbM family methyltransferase
VLPDVKEHRSVRLSMVPRYAALVPAVAQALVSDRIRVDRLRLRIPGSRAIRLSVLAGNVRMRAIVDAVVREGDTVVDVGANIGAITAYAAVRVGRSGHVVAVEPAADNLAILRENLRANRLSNVTVVEGAAGRARETRQLYLRGDVSAVNSLYPESCYASVTGTAAVRVERLDDILEGRVALVKIDVEGAEIDVLAGMPRLLAQPAIAVAAEWHPTLQRAGGWAPDALPLALLDAGLTVHAVGHLTIERLTRAEVPRLAARLLAREAPVELFCRRQS